MQHSSLISFLNGEKSPNELWREIETEVTECMTAATTLGCVGHVIITDGPHTIINRRHVDVLVGRLADGILPVQAAAYIADALIMSDDFDFAEDGVSEILFLLSDESAPLSREDVQALRSRLSTGA
ncbi:hypothetical protein OHD62_27530 [Mesorhizobium sp. YC-39]|uniref:hypothetical protein n=1 Tax=unclassified Mesorhizobium TaxID=325217 RepID=UPI0021E89672|nr:MULTISPECIES: hypothetical protein [unclassified Mesorhizobium]MCV3208509.1 hypothetical protein [Mesorhizobium sp. YC-2]MCV3232142.1 hypothetical protein [Mesorhizobium sp. YC-39]